MKKIIKYITENIRPPLLALLGLIHSRERNWPGRKTTQ
jgi:hypothetical protein